MNPAFRFSAAADRDLEGIYFYGARRFGAGQAMQYKALLEEAFRLLCENTGVGRAEPRFSQALRRFECGSHILFYKEQEYGILIVRILHKSSDVSKALSPSPAQ